MMYYLRLYVFIHFYLQTAKERRAKGMKKWAQFNMITTDQHIDRPRWKKTRILFILPKITPFCQIICKYVCCVYAVCSIPIADDDF